MKSRANNSIVFVEFLLKFTSNNAFNNFDFLKSQETINVLRFRILRNSIKQILLQNFEHMKKSSPLYTN